MADHIDNTTYQVRIRRVSRRVRKHFALIHHGNVRIVVLEPLLGLTGQVPRVEEVVAPRRAVAAVDEHARKLVSDLVVVRPQRLEFGLERDDLLLQAVNL